MNTIPIEIVMYVTGLSEEQLPLLHEVDTDTIRSLVENPNAELIYQIDRRSGMHIFRFATIARLAFDQSLRSLRLIFSFLAS